MELLKLLPCTGSWLGQADIFNAPKGILMLIDFKSLEVHIQSPNGHQGTSKPNFERDLK